MLTLDNSLSLAGLIKVLNQIRDVIVIVLILLVLTLVLGITAGYGGGQLLQVSQRLCTKLVQNAWGIGSN